MKYYYTKVVKLVPIRLFKMNKSWPTACASLSTEYLDYGAWHLARTAPINGEEETGCHLD
jgi:hypothetical protein